VNFPDWFKLLGIAVVVGLALKLRTTLVVVTAALFMRDQYGVIKFQLPFALTIWSLHVLLMWTLIRMFGW
jgi:uncharacterized membrane protein